MGRPVITLLGAADSTLECGVLYTDPGVTATDDEDGDITANVIRIGTVNPQSAGVYVVVYNVSDSDGNSAAQVSRTVTVADTTRPTVVRVGPATVTQACGMPFLELGATASDQCDGTLSVQVESNLDVDVPGTYTVTYSATDSAGLTASTIRTVVVADSEGPAITLLGANPLRLNCGSPYVEAGATALDACEDTEAEVTIVNNTVNASVPGTYVVTYQAQDGSGNTSVASREVVVSDTAAPTITLNGAAIVEIDCGTTYTDAGATALDACEGPVNVVDDAEAVVNTDVPGTYEVTYVAVDGLGNQAIATREVIVGGPVCEGGGAICPLESFEVLQPAGGFVFIPEGEERQRVLFTARAGFAAGDNCASGTARVSYRVDGATQTTENLAGDFPSVFFLPPGEHEVEAEIEIVETGRTLTQRFTLTLAGLADANADGLPDAPFTGLPEEGDTWTADRSARGGEGTTTLTTWFGPCESEDGTVELAVRNPENANQVLRVSVDRALLDCGEQGLLAVALGESLEQVLTPGEAARVPGPPSGMAGNGLFFEVSIVVSDDGGETFAPIASARLAANPVRFRLSGITIPDAEGATFSRFPTVVTPDGAGGFTIDAGQGAWSSAAIDDVVVEGGVITAESSSLSLFVPIAPAGAKEPNGATCSPGQGGFGTPWGDLLLALALTGALLAVTRNRARAAS